MVALLVSGVLAGCGEDADEQVPDEPAAETLPATWTGVFPCSNCPGIDVTLWLRPDGRFFIEQRYRQGEGEGDVPAPAYGLGRWQWRTGEQHLELTGEGPPRLFERPGEDVLLMHTASPEEHRLERGPGPTEFTGIIRVRGIVTPQGDGYVFRECLTDYAKPLAKSAEYSRFARQFRSVVPRGASAPVEFEGRYEWTATGDPAAFHVERFITLRQSGGC